MKKEVRLYIDCLLAKTDAPEFELLTYQTPDGEVMMECYDGTFTRSFYSSHKERLDKIAPNRFIYIGSI